MITAQEAAWRRFGDTVLKADPGLTAQVHWVEGGGGLRLEGLSYTAHCALMDAVHRLWEDCGKPEGPTPPLEWATDEMLTYVEAIRGEGAILRLLLDGTEDGAVRRSIRFTVLAKDVHRALLAQKQQGPSGGGERKVKPRLRPGLRKQLQAHWKAKEFRGTFPTQSEIAGQAKVSLETVRNWESGSGGRAHAGVYIAAIEELTGVVLPEEMILQELPARSPLSTADDQGQGARDEEEADD